MAAGPESAPAEGYANPGATMTSVVDDARHAPERRGVPGSLLVAAPGLSDPNFRRTVVYVIEHRDRGTLGVV
jgi:putative transcriptional regulator